MQPLTTDNLRELAVLLDDAGIEHKMVAFKRKDKSIVLTNYHFAMIFPEGQYEMNKPLKAMLADGKKSSHHDTMSATDWLEHVFREGFPPRWNVDELERDHFKKEDAWTVIVIGSKKISSNYNPVYLELFELFVNDPKLKISTWNPKVSAPVAVLDGKVIVGAVMNIGINGEHNGLRAKG